MYYFYQFCFSLSEGRDFKVYVHVTGLIKDQEDGIFILSPLDCPQILCRHGFAMTSYFYFLDSSAPVSAITSFLVKPLTPTCFARLSWGCGLYNSCGKFGVKKLFTIKYSTLTFASTVSLAGLRNKQSWSPLCQPFFREAHKQLCSNCEEMVL